MSKALLVIECVDHLSGKGGARNIILDGSFAKCCAELARIAEEESRNPHECGGPSEDAITWLDVHYGKAITIEYRVLTYQEHVE